MATKKHPDDVEARATDVGGTDDPKEGVDYYLLDNGIPMPMPDIPRTFHPMELSANPAVVAAMPSYLIDDSQPMSTSIRSGDLMMLPDATQEERVEAYKAVSAAHAAQLQAQIDQAQAALDAMAEVQDPPPPPEPPEVAPTSTEDMTKKELQGELEDRGLPTSGNKADLAARLEEDEASSESEPGFPPPNE